jgi:pimeloyl-ACP methyl ester carboxylesterase
MNKAKVQNRNDVDLAVATEGEGNETGLDITANTIGESGGSMEDATLTNYFEDLEDVTVWASLQAWYKEPFVIAGHSLGGASALMYAAKYPARVKAIVPVSSFIGGELRLETLDKDEVQEWKKKGFIEEVSKSKPGVVKKISWNFMEDAMQHDMRTLADKITCPALFIVGSEDDMTPAKHQEIIISHLNSPAELHVVEGMEHSPRIPEHNAELKGILLAWLHDLS